MKIAIIILLTLITNPLCAQISCIIGDSIQIELDKYSMGNIEWQSSTNLKDWVSLRNENRTFIKRIILKDLYIRAKVDYCQNQTVSEIISITTYPKLQAVNDTIILKWLHYKNIDSVSYYKVSIPEINLSFQVNKSSSCLKIPFHPIYYNKLFKVETINNNKIVSTQNIIYEANIKIYGIKLDLTKPYLNICERINCSKNLTTEIKTNKLGSYIISDFDTIYPYSQMRLCNLIKTDKTISVIYSNHNQFSRTNNTFVEIPKFYTSRFRYNNFEYFLITKDSIPGFSLDPSFKKNGEKIENIYIATYESSLVNGELSTISQEYPLINQTIEDFRTLANKSGFNLIDYKALNTIQLLFLVEFANKNSQKILGDGMVGLTQPSNIYPFRNENESNSLILKDTEQFILDHYWINMNICFDKEDTNNIIVRKITNIKTNYPQKGLHTIYFDGEKVNITTKDAFGAFAQNSGLTDIITNSGRSIQNGLDINKTDKCSIKYREIENLWGNVWEFIDGISLNNLYPEISLDNPNTYIKINIPMPCNESNGTINSTSGYIANMIFDINHPNLLLPESIGSSSCDYNNGFGDYFYSSKESRYYLIFGGGWDHYYRAGLFCMRFWGTQKTKWYLYGSRMMYK
jgi:hypothetical protein